jgi:hypothetical protein
MTPPKPGKRRSRRGRTADGPRLVRAGSRIAQHRPESESSQRATAACRVPVAVTAPAKPASHRRWNRGV